MSFELLVLGAAAGGGLPQWNCATSNSAAVWRGDPSVAVATQSSVAVGTAGHWTLLNASPDIRQQILSQPKLHPTAVPGDQKRRSPIGAVLLTDGDLDHITGLLSLRERTPFRLIATQTTLCGLAANPVFDSLSPSIVERETANLGQWVHLANGLRARLFAVPGKVPLYLEKAQLPLQTDEVTDGTVGVEMNDGARKFFYVPSCAKMTADLKDRIQGADLVLFDGTVFHDDELIKCGVGEKTGRRMGHMPMCGPGGSVEAFRSIDVGRKIYIHINNTNPVWQTESEERFLLEEAGWEIAYDGLEISL